MSSRKVTTTKIPLSYTRENRSSEWSIACWKYFTDLETGLPRIEPYSYLDKETRIRTGEVKVFEEPVYCIIDDPDHDVGVVKQIAEFPKSKSSIFLVDPSQPRAECVPSSHLKEIESLKIESKIGGLYLVRVTMKGCKVDLVVSTRISGQNAYTISKSDENFIVPNTAHLPLRLSDIQEDL